MKTNLIGVNGKIGSGKDTVGRIIQYLCAGADKANISYDNWDGKPIWGTENNKFHKSTWEIKKFAGKLKLVGSILSGVPVEMWEDQEFKKQEMPEEWWYWSNSDNTTTKIPYIENTKILAKSNSDIVLYKTTYREFLQKLGTEAMRDGLHTNVWVNALFADYKTVIPVNDEHFDHINTGHYKLKHDVSLPNWIITDMRFPNEMEAVKEREGITIRVVRPHGYTNPHTGEYKEMPLSYHSSETALDESKFDYEILNDGTIADLVEKVKEILIKEKIL